MVAGSAATERDSKASAFFCEQPYKSDTLPRVRIDRATGPPSIDHIHLHCTFPAIRPTL